MINQYYIFNLYYIISLFCKKLCFICARDSGSPAEQTIGEDIFSLISIAPYSIGIYIFYKKLVMSEMKKLTNRSLIISAFFLSMSFSNMAFAAEKKPYSFLFLSNPVVGKEDSFLNWYTGQHIHDLLAIKGFVAARFYQLADTQFVGSHPQRYMMIWEIETDDLPGVFELVNHGLKSGSTVLVGAVDGATANSNTFTPITTRVTAEQIRGMTPTHVQEIAMGKAP